MAWQLVPPQRRTQDSAQVSHRLDDGRDSRGGQCLHHDDAGLDDDDCSWITPKDMALLKALAAADASRGTLQHHGRPKMLPRGTRPLKLVGEGSANAVFELKLPRHNGSVPEFHGVLLRVAKVPSLNAHPTYDYLAQQKFFQYSIKPLLGKHVVHQELVILRASGIIDELNKFLRDINHSRAPKFRGSFIGQADWGFLVEDMRPQDANESLLVEFKPKWLSQSPSAPKAAVRCRQCAMELRNLVKNPSSGRAMPENKPCPLSLVNKNAPKQTSSPFRIAPNLSGVDGGEHFGDVLVDVANHTAIHDLKRHQDDHDACGPLKAEPSNPCFNIAMTLRDCTCFVQIHRRERSMKLRLGDFDWKNPKVKMDHWRGAEEELIAGGFYTADWIVCDGLYYRMPTLCTLEYSRTSANNPPEVLHIRDGDGAAEPVRPLQAASRMKVFHHTTDLAALQPLLEPYKLEAPKFS
ncbi:hypothetical protein DCS_01153 [Drechmeria coniospora]|uniref:Inositol-pentakisphosphate 2-kinase n=1 Tax=Drechmeria coniospora TaxID=98403 RepID=A0A151GSD4_DRECN|nr:hypothetical protein DCS_01153 [Drechmeria coniospora]KYK60019.1 hypothetical protein DCS_01153 [Drechmeria coniospora]